MSFTRAFLKATGLSEEQISAVIEEHTAVVDTLKNKRDEMKAEADRYKQEAEKATDLQRKLDELSGGEDYKSLYEKEHTDFEAYKADIIRKAEAEKIKEAYRKLLNEEHISDKRHDAIIRVTDFTDMKLDKDGNLANPDAIRQGINDTWSDFKVSVKQRGAQSETPLREQSNGGDTSIRELTAKWHAEKYGAPKSEGNGEKK